LFSHFPHHTNIFRKLLQIQKKINTNYNLEWQNELFYDLCVFEQVKLAQQQAKKAGGFVCNDSSDSSTSSDSDYDMDATGMPGMYHIHVPLDLK